MKNFTTIFFLFAITSLFAQNQAPQISNLAITLNGDETLTINYDLMDVENDEVMVTLHVSDNGGNYFEINTDNATGDLNTMIQPGNNKTIDWDYSTILNTSDNYRIKLVADDMQVVDIQDIVNQVDSNNLKTDLAFIEGVRHRNTGAVHLQEVRDLLNDRFLNNNLDTEKQEFNYGAYIGENYVGTHLGTTDDEQIYILDGHYDGVSNSPAVDDNGTAVAGMLEAARILSNYNFKKTIRFIGFDLEEAGLRGSKAYVANLPEEDTIAGVLNFEMIGYYRDEVNTQNFSFGFEILYPDIYSEIQADSFRGNFLANIGIVNQNDWEQSFANAAATYVPDLKVITFNGPENWSILTPDLGRSDHAPFWNAEHPAVMLTNTSEFRNPNYHTLGDTLGTINFDFMTNIVKAAVATLAEVAELQNSTFATDSINIIINSVSEVSTCNVQIFPNPVVDVLQVKWEDCGQLIDYVKVYSVDGKLVLNEQFSPRSEYSISTKELKEGVYLLETEIGVKRFLKR